MRSIKSPKKMSPELPPLLLPLLLLGSAHSWPAPPARDEILRGLALGHGERAPPCNIDVVHYPFFSKREFDRRYRGIYPVIIRDATARWERISSAWRDFGATAR